MALIKCIECGADVSDKAAACPKCGHPISFSATQPASEFKSPTTVEGKGGWQLKWVFIVPSVLFGLVMCIGLVSDPDGKLASRRSEERKKECTEALMSSIGHSTIGYADKAAYDAKVREKCAGLTIDGKPLGQ